MPEKSQKVNKKNRAASLAALLTAFIFIMSAFGLYCRAEAYGEFLLTGNLELDNKDFSVFIHADHTNDVRGGEGTLVFDRNQLKVNALNLRLPEGFELRYRLEGGELRFVFWGEEEMSGSVILFSVDFEVLSGNTDDTVEIKLTDGAITDGYTESAYPDASYISVLKTEVSAPPTTVPPVTESENYGTDSGADTESETHSTLPPHTTDTVTGKETDTKPAQTGNTDNSDTIGFESNTENKQDTTGGDPREGKRGAVVWILLSVLLTAAVLTAAYLFVKSKKKQRPAEK